MIKTNQGTLQIFCEVILDFKAIFKSIVDLECTFQSGLQGMIMNDYLVARMQDRRDQLEALDLDVGRQKARLEAMQMTEKELKKSQRLALGELKDLQRDNDMRALRK